MITNLINVANLAGDFTVDSTTQKIFTHSLMAGSGVPTVTPTVTSKRWLWLDLSTNRLTHYWNGSTWIVLNYAFSLTTTSAPQATYSGGVLNIPTNRTTLLLNSTVSTTSTTFTNVSGWSFTTTAGKNYKLEIIGSYQTGVTTTGCKLGITYSGTGTIRGYLAGEINSAAATSELKASLYTVAATAGTGNSITTSGATPANTPHYIGMNCIFTATTAGTINIQFATEVAPNAALLLAGSVLIIEQLN